jgi:hypothetical protein
VRANRITSFVLSGVVVMLAVPAQAADFASAAGRGSTLTVVGLATLVLAALVFGLFHWIETAQTRRLNASPTPVDTAQNDRSNDDPALAAPKLAVVPANPMLDALSRKQSGADAEPSNVSMAALDDGEADGQLAAAQ